MEWRIIVSPLTQKQLSAVTDRRVQQSLERAIESLGSDSDKKGKPLTGKLAGYRSLRAASQKYRIVYKVDFGAERVFILTVGLRKEGDRADVYALAERILRAGLLTLLVLLFTIADIF